ncbi:MAG: histidine kinase dimerization/phosphoacceptor domain -containing protein [Balneolaceae bacterium]|nr:histidine kinase dimerization/phosphoacceptor domain -containing protein [Balneolaceae bacterium]
METAKKSSTLRVVELKDQSSESLHLLLESIEGLNKSMELQSLLSESMESARLVMNSEASSLMLLDEETGELFISLPTGPVKDEIKGKRIPKNKGVGGWVIENKRPYLSNDLENSEIFFGEVAEEFQTRNIICVPLIDSRNNAMGVLQAINKRGLKDFTPHDIPVFQALASHVSMAIERTRMEERMKSRIKQKEVLLTEIHHRVKNNLATISGLIEMELDTVEDKHARHVLKNTYSRMQSMGEVHDMLCKKGLFDEVELGMYLSNLTEKISKTLSNPNTQVNITVEADTIQMAADRAMICGLVLNELLVNIYKHAFEDLEEGNITINLLALKDNKIQLDVRDNGIGIPEEFSLEDASSIGTWVINVLLRKLNSTVEINSSEGTSFSIRFDK